MASSENGTLLFSTFVMGMASATLIELGVIEDPQRKEKRVNREAAQQHIELLTMLSKKTQGNLDEGEKELLGQVLTDLRLQFAKQDSVKK